MPQPWRCSRGARGPDAAKLAAALHRRHRAGEERIRPAPADLFLGERAAGDGWRITITPLRDHAVPVWVDFDRRSRLSFLVMAAPLLPPGSAPSTRALTESFDLTPAEAEHLLAAGLGVKDIAARRRTSVGTVHVQLKQIYQKTETHGQADLLVKLLGAGRPAGDA